MRKKDLFIFQVTSAYDVFCQTGYILFYTSLSAIKREKISLKIMLVGQIQHSSGEKFETRVLRFLTSTMLMLIVYT